MGKLQIVLRSEYHLFKAKEQMLIEIWKLEFCELIIFIILI